MRRKKQLPEISITKVANVIQSCDNLEQLESAFTYFNLYKENYSYLPYHKENCDILYDILLFKEKVLSK